MKKMISLLMLMILGISVQVSAQVINGPWKGELSFGSNQLNLVFHIQADKAEQYTCKMDSPDQGAKGIPAAITVTTDSIRITVAAIGASYEGRISEKRIEGQFKQSGMSFPLTLEPGSVELKRPQTPQTPYPYRTEEITFINPEDNAQFSGTLSYPLNYDEAKAASIPVVLLVTGSGQQNRNEEVFEHKPFAVIADYLARRGIATLRYDDRGVGQSQRGSLAITTYTNMQDVAAGLDYLKKNYRFGRVGVLGHSEGGCIAFMLGARQKADFVISLAGGGIPGDSVIVTQNHAMLLQNGTPPKTADDYCNVLREVFHYKIAHSQATHPQQVLDSLTASVKAKLPDGAKQKLLAILTRQDPWIDYFIAYDPADDIAHCQCPVMAINGSRDMQVDPNLNLNAIRQYLPSNPQNLVQEYVGLNHLFQNCTTGSPMEYNKIEETIEPKVLQDIVNWIKGLK